jgi:hypothetical protein
MPQQFRLAQDMAEAVASDTQLQDQIRQNPVAALQNLAAPVLQTDAWIYRIVVSALGIGMLATIIAVCLLSAYDKKTPDGVIAIGSAAVGALAGLLAPSPAQRS